MTSKTIYLKSALPVQELVNDFTVETHKSRDGSQCSLCGREISSGTVVIHGALNPQDNKNGYLFAEQKCLRKLAK